MHEQHKRRLKSTAFEHTTRGKQRIYIHSQNCVAKPDHFLSKIHRTRRLPKLQQTSREAPLEVIRSRTLARSLPISTITHVTHYEGRALPRAAPVFSVRIAFIRCCWSFPPKRKSVFPTASSEWHSREPGASVSSDASNWNHITTDGPASNR